MRHSNTRLEHAPRERAECPGVRPGPGQPDRRAHRLQRRSLPPVRGRARRHRDRRARRRRRDRGARAGPGRARPLRAWRGRAARRERLALLRARRRRRAAARGHRAAPLPPRRSPATCRAARACPRRPPFASRSASRSARSPAPSRRSRIALARLCSRVENDWTGAHTGLLDPLASLCGERGRAVRIDMRGPRAARRPARPPRPRAGHARLGRVARRSRPTPATTSAARSARAACRALGIDSLRDATSARGPARPARPARAPCDLARTSASTPRWPRSRPATSTSSARLLDASHRSLRDDYEVSVPEVERAVADAGETPRRRRGSHPRGALGVVAEQRPRQVILRRGAIAGRAMDAEGHRNALSEAAFGLGDEARFTRNLGAEIQFMHRRPRGPTRHPAAPAPIASSFSASTRSPLSMSAYPRLWIVQVHLVVQSCIAVCLLGECEVRHHLVEPSALHADKRAVFQAHVRLTHRRLRESADALAKPRLGVIQEAALEGQERAELPLKLSHGPPRDGHPPVERFERDPATNGGRRHRGVRGHTRWCRRCGPEARHHPRRQHALAEALVSVRRACP